MDAKINDFWYLFEKGEKPRNYLKTNRILGFRHAERYQQSIPNLCKIYAKSMHEKCLQKAWTIMLKCIQNVVLSTFRSCLWSQRVHGRKKCRHPAKNNDRASTQEGEKGGVNLPLGRQRRPENRNLRFRIRIQNRRRDLHATTGGSADFVSFIFLYYFVFKVCFGPCRF